MRAVPELYPLLSHDDFHMREAAVMTLGQPVGAVHVLGLGQTEGHLLLGDEPPLILQLLALVNPVRSLTVRSRPDTHDMIAGHLRGVDLMAMLPKLVERLYDTKGILQPQT